MRRADPLPVGERPRAGRPAGGGAGTLSGSPDGLPVALFATAADFERWLEAHHANAAGVWLKIARKGSGERSVDHPEALGLALAFGWIDGQRRALDETHFLQRFTPRRRRSRWSRINREKAETLMEQGRMRPAGLAEVEAAREDGRWDAAYHGQRSAAVPDDLRAELAARPDAARFFEGLDSRNRYSILYRLDEAKRPETRERRLRKFVAMLERGEKLYP